MHVFLNQTLRSQLLFPEYSSFDKWAHCDKCCCNISGLVTFRAIPRMGQVSPHCSWSTEARGEAAGGELPASASSLHSLRWATAWQHLINNKCTQRQPWPLAVWFCSRGIFIQKPAQAARGIRSVHRLDSTQQSWIEGGFPLCFSCSHNFFSHQYCWLLTGLGSIHILSPRESFAFWGTDFDFCWTSTTIAAIFVCCWSFQTATRASWRQRETQYSWYPNPAENCTSGSRTAWFLEICFC